MPAKDYANVPSQLPKAVERKMKQRLKGKNSFRCKNSNHDLTFVLIFNFFFCAFRSVTLSLLKFSSISSINIITPWDSLWLHNFEKLAFTQMVLTFTIKSKYILMNSEIDSTWPPSLHHLRISNHRSQNACPINLNIWLPTSPITIIKYSTNVSQCHFR